MSLTHPPSLPLTPLTGSGFVPGYRTEPPRQKVLKATEAVLLEEPKALLEKLSSPAGSRVLKPAQGQKDQLARLALASRALKATAAVRHLTRIVDESIAGIGVRCE